MADNKLLGAGGLYYGGNEIRKAYMGNNLVWEKEEINPFIKEYFTIQSLEDNNTITFNKYAGDISMPDKPIKYSKDLNTWTDISFVSGQRNKIVLNRGEKLYLKGNNSTYGRIVSTSRYDYYAYAQILADKKIDVMGNIMSLVYGDNFINNNTIESSCTFLKLFNGNNKLVNAKDLILPATALTDYCYYDMFYSCIALTTAPELLPATTLAKFCYSGMFIYCEALTTAPELPATTLTDYCYSRMFYYCDALTTAPELPATTLAKACYSSMFYSCQKLNYIKAMFTTTPSTTYTRDWVSNVSPTGTFVKNSAATWNVTGDYGIPSRWTVQTASS